MPSATSGNRFIEVTRGNKKSKAVKSPTLHSPLKPGSSELPPGTPVCPKTTRKNTIPLIISGVDNKSKTLKKKTNERIEAVPPQSQSFQDIKEAVGDILQDVIILQNEKKVRAAHYPNMLKLVFPKPSKPTKPGKVP